MAVISVIIPTHNRSASLRRTLGALCRQSFPASQFEVHVVADGCTDGTVEMLRSYGAPFALHVAEQPGKGQAAARNLGASLAQSPLLLFLDDDVEPVPDLVAEHVLAHQNETCRVVVAPYPPAFASAGFLPLRQRAWWERVFETVCRPGHRFTYKDLLGGNFSISVVTFKQAGGFEIDPALRAHEDYEFGIRLLKAGVRFTSAPAALAHHHDNSDLRRVLQRKRQEGIADVFLARRHPEIGATLPFLSHWLMNIGPYATALLKRLAFAPPGIRNGLDELLIRSLHLLERLRLRTEWNRLFTVLQANAYWCGVAESTPTFRSLQQMIKARYRHDTSTTNAVPPLILDLQCGLGDAERQLDEQRPMAVRLRFGSRDVGYIPFMPGAEPLNSAHLRPLLATKFAVPYLQALVLEGAVDSALGIEDVSQSSREALAQAISRRAPWFGPTQQGQVWFEQYGQWSELEWQLSKDGQNSSK